MKKQEQYYPPLITIQHTGDMTPLCYSYDENNLTEYWNTEDYEEL